MSARNESGAGEAAERGPLIRQRILLELCAGSISDVLLAAEFAVDRIELNSGIALGGLTPSMGLMHESRREFTGPIIAMVRPREGGFCYSAHEFQQMLIDAQLLLDAGADGLAVGFLTKQGTIDVSRCDAFRHRFPGTELVFHRAFDAIPCLKTGLSQLIDCGWNRILSSGGRATALEGSSILRELCESARGRIELLPGGGIRPTNVTDIVRHTGIPAVHSALGTLYDDGSLNPGMDVQYGSQTAGSAGQYAGISRSLLELMLEATRGSAENVRPQLMNRAPGESAGVLPVIDSCSGCSACCRRTPIPPFFPGEEAILNVPEELLSDVQARIAADQQFDLLPCVWLDLATGLCRYYELRPSACRDFQVGGDLCRLSRWDEGLEA